MSSIHDDAIEGSSESTENSDEEMSDSSSPSKFDGSNEHAKPICGGRRGKKRKQRKTSGAASRADAQQTAEQAEESTETESEKHCCSWDSEDEDLEDDSGMYDDSIMVRPTDVPKAPENSTQFIIDDHDECGLYMSFETPNPYLCNYLHSVEDDNSEIIEPDGEDAAYVDINYEYESPHDFDNSAYYDREFELSYKNNRFDELLRLQRNDLITGLQNLESHLKELNEDLVKEDPDPVLERLQSELLELQEKHSVLKRQNVSLRTCLQESGVDCEMGENSVLEKQHEQSSEGETKSREESLTAKPEESLDSSEQTDKSRVDASNKENACLEACPVRGVPVKEKVVLRDSEFHEDVSHNSSVPEEPSAVTA